MNLNRRQTGIVEMVLAMGLSGTLGYFVLEANLPVWNIVFFRCVFGLLGLGIYCWWRGFLTPWPLAGRNLLFASLAGCALVANWLLLFGSYQYASISLSTAVYHTQPFFLLLLAKLFFAEAFDLRKLPWYLIAFAGLLLIIEFRWSGLENSQQLLGFLMALGAAVLYAVTTLFTRQVEGVRPEVIAFLHVMIGSVLLLPVLDLTALPVLASQWWCLIVLGFVHTCLMYIFLYSAYQKLPVALIAILAFLYPAIAILVDYLIYDQSLSVLQWLGIMAVLFSATAMNAGWSPLKWRMKQANKV